MLFSGQACETFEFFFPMSALRVRTFYPMPNPKVSSLPNPPFFRCELAVSFGEGKFKFSTLGNFC